MKQFDEATYEVPVVQTSFASFDLESRFDLVYVVFNSFFSLLTQEEQVSCF
jgi:F0F1-type ATP synthase gamma subunit